MPFAGGQRSLTICAMCIHLDKISERHGETDRTEMVKLRRAVDAAHAEARQTICLLTDLINRLK